MDNQPKTNEITKFSQARVVLNAFLAATIVLIFISFVMDGQEDVTDGTSTEVSLAYLLIFGVMATVSTVAGVVLARKAVDQYLPKLLPIAGALFESMMLYALLAVLVADLEPIYVVPVAAVSILLNLTMLPRSHINDDDSF